MGFMCTCKNLHDSSGVMMKSYRSPLFKALMGGRTSNQVVGEEGRGGLGGRGVARSLIWGVGWLHGGRLAPCL